MKYFVMIDGRREGPFALEQLPAAGVGPSTYVWCKGMSDWQPARDLPDICRLFRNRLFDLGRPQNFVKDNAEYQEEDEPDEDPNMDSVPVRFRSFVEESGTPVGEPVSKDENISDAPVNMVAIAMLSVALCIPFGIVAVVFAFRSQRCWKQAEMLSRTKNTESELKQTERNHGAEIEKLRQESHDLVRKTKMWVGFSIFASLIEIAILVHNVL